MCVCVCVCVCVCTCMYVCMYVHAHVSHADQVHGRDHDQSLLLLVQGPRAHRHDCHTAHTRPRGVVQDQGETHDADRVWSWHCRWTAQSECVRVSQSYMLTCLTVMPRPQDPPTMFTEDYQVYSKSVRVIFLGNGYYALYSPN